MEPIEAFYYGTVGGLLGEGFAMWKLKEDGVGALPQHFKSWFYWLMTLFMIATGGFLAFLYVKSGNLLTPLLAVNIGTTAPIMIGALVAKPPPTP